MKKILLITLTLVLYFTSQAQITGSFVVGSASSSTTYYPVVFTDNGWFSNVATEFTLGRSSVHQDGTWHGSEIAKFRLHVNAWGNGANFIDADIVQNQSGGVVINNFIGGWADATIANSTKNFVIWLRGGATTYYYSSNYAITPVVYDGVSNSLPYTTPTDGVVFNSKATPDNYVNQQGTSFSRPIYVYGTANNYFAGNVGIGTATPQSLLQVVGDITVGQGAGQGTAKAGRLLISDGTNGTASINGNHTDNSNVGIDFTVLNASTALDAVSIKPTGNMVIGQPTAGNPYNANYLLDVKGYARANKLVVNTNGADFVFEPTYKLTPLNKVEEFIKANHHLPGIEPAAQMQKDGVDVGSNQAKLLQKIEELTLYVIELKKELDLLKKDSSCK